MQRNVLSLVGVFLAGLLIGWLAIGWWLCPVAYVGDAYPYELNQVDRLRYAQGAVDGFTLTGQVDPDWFARWTPEEVSQTLAQVAAQPNRQAAAYSLLAKLGYSGLASPARITVIATPVPLTVKLSKAEASESSISNKLIYVGLALLVILAMGVGMWLIRREKGKARVSSPDFEWTPNPHILPTVPGEFQGLRQAVRTASQLAQARLEFGPGLPTDQHFPIEGGGVHLGEFGVNQVDDQPAWDVWLFDQRAIVTVTKVLGPNEEVKTELESRGDFIGWGPILLETPALKMTGRVFNLHIMHGAPSTQGFSVELTVEAKDRLVLVIFASAPSSYRKLRWLRTLKIESYHLAVDHSLAHHIARLTLDQLC